MKCESFGLFRRILWNQHFKLKNKETLTVAFVFIAYFEYTKAVKNKKIYNYDRVKSRHKNAVKNNLKNPYCRIRIQIFNT